MLFEDFSIRSFEVELNEGIMSTRETMRTATHPFIDPGLGVGFGGGSGSVNDGHEFGVVPVSNLICLVSFIGHGNGMKGPGARLEEIMLERTLGRLL
jgi:hypothetical protein